MSFFKSNLEALNKIEPYLAQKINKVKFNKDDLSPYLNQSFDLNIDEDLKYYDIIIILGFGLGDHIRKTIKHSSKSSLILIIDHNINAFRSLLELFDISDILSSPQISISIDENLLLATRGRIEQYFGGMMFAVSFCTIKNPLSLELAPKFYEEVIEKLTETLYIAYLNIGTTLHFGFSREKQAIVNLPEIVRCHGANSLGDKFKNIPAIIVSSGPSLTKNISWLKYAKGKSLIFGVDTALKVLSKYHIEPDFAVSIEARSKNYLCFKGLKFKNTCLLASVDVSPRTIARFKGSKFFVNSDNNIINWYSKTINFQNKMSLGTNVSSAAFHLAINLGANPIIFTGQDLSYPQGKFYAEGVDTFFVEGKVGDAPKRKAILLDGISGGKVVSDEGMLIFLRWFEREIAKHKDRIFINATEGGARICGTKVLTLKETIDTYCNQHINTSKVIKNISVVLPSINIKDIISSTKTLIEEYQAALIYSNQGKDIIKRAKTFRSKHLNNSQLQDTLSTIIKDITSLPNFMVANKLLIECLLHRLKRDRSNKALSNHMLFFKEISKFSSQLASSLEKTLSKLESMTN